VKLWCKPWWTKRKWECRLE